MADERGSRLVTTGQWLWCGGAVVRRCGGAEVRRCGGAAVRRCDGAVVPRCGGATVRWSSVERCGNGSSRIIAINKIIIVIIMFAYFSLLLFICVYLRNDSHTRAYTCTIIIIIICNNSFEKEKKKNYKRT